MQLNQLSFDFSVDFYFFMPLFALSLFGFRVLIGTVASLLHRL